MDLIIRGGRIVDGTGLPAFVGDLGIADGVIRQVGGTIANPGGAREIDAAGRIVSPGFIDPHTHFDVQLLWDGQARPALEHGITTIVPGNCSLSLAPLKAEHRPRLVGMFQQIEEMPDAAFDGAFDWTWESFDGYLDALRGQLAINVAPLAGHSVIRLWVMGEAATQRAANAEEIAAMQDLLRQCLEAGAVGLSTSFVDVDENLMPVPSRYAHLEEMDALAAVLGEFGRVLQVVPEFYATDITRARVDQLAELSLKYRIPTTFSPLFDSAATPDNVARVMERVHEQMARGARVWPQVQTRPIDISFTFEQASLMFAFIPAWYMTMRLPLEEKRAAFSNEEHVKGLLELAEPGGDVSRWAGIRVRTVERAEDAYLVGRTLGEIAAERGTSPARVMIELSLANDLKASFLAANLGHDDVDRVGPLLADPCVHVGASDGGAHIQTFSTYGDTGYLFSAFVRGGHLTLEQAVKKITSDPAHIWGIRDRGLLQPGLAADVTVFDAETIDRDEEVAAHDMPEGGMRYVRGSKGVETVIVGGEIAWSRATGYTDARRGAVVSG
ncbi:MAG: amidohydrolase family protein [Pseudomonadales bacterium]|jgi:N-acyl-D-aspartate/D-glutamate deacylase|nr:amidohydrolase family protein [Pseudomonadales bacterium]